MRRSLLFLVALAAVAVAGCGSDSSSSSDSASTSTPADTPAGSGSTITVEMKNLQFVPKEISATVGQTIKWVDVETIQHNVVADSGADFKSDVFGQNGTFEWTATKPGKVEYECTLHPGMVGTITVR